MLSPKKTDNNSLTKSKDSLGVKQTGKQKQVSRSANSTTHLEVYMGTTSSLQKPETKVDSPTLRSMSFNPFDEELPLKKKYCELLKKLETLKSDTDRDCKVFELELSEMKSPPQGRPTNYSFSLDHHFYSTSITMADELINVSKKIRVATVNELKDGLCLDIVGQLSKLNRAAELYKNPDEYVKETRKMVRKLMFTFHRCSCHIEILNKCDPEKPQEIICEICEEVLSPKEFQIHIGLCKRKREATQKAKNANSNLKKLYRTLKTYLNDDNELMTTIFTAMVKIAKSASEIPFDKEGQADTSLLIEDVKGIEKNYGFDLTVRMFTNRLEAMLFEKSEAIFESLSVGLITKPGKKANIQEYDLLKVLGSGGHGRVFLLRHQKLKDVYAVKVLRREDGIHAKLYKRIKTEKSIMMMRKNDHIVKMYWTQTGPQLIYMFMEYMPGGDLLRLIRAEGYFSEDWVARYGAEILLALEFLHNLTIVHRDLKPDNILLGKDGHLKLSDFGLSDLGVFENNFFDDTSSESSSTGSTTGSSGSDSMVYGTPDYLAPELLMGSNHSYPVDLWAFGVVFFEMLTGCPPFNDETPEAIFDNILSLNIYWPVEGSLSDAAMDLIKKLLVHDPKERYTIDQIKNHEFFKNIDWKTVLLQRPPFVPKVLDWGNAKPHGENTTLMGKSHTMPN